MKLERRIFRLTMSILQLEEIIPVLDDIMDSDNTLTDKEYNSIREAHDYISNARDILERLIKQKK